MNFIFGVAVDYIINFNIFANGLLDIYFLG